MECGGAPHLEIMSCYWCIISSRRGSRQHTRYPSYAFRLSSLSCRLFGTNVCIWYVPTSSVCANDRHSITYGFLNVGKSGTRPAQARTTGRGPWQWLPWISICRWQGTKSWVDIHMQIQLMIGSPKTWKSLQSSLWVSCFNISKYIDFALKSYLFVLFNGNVS